MKELHIPTLKTMLVKYKYKLPFQKPHSLHPFKNNAC